MADDDMTPEEIEHSLIKCIIGTISNFDLWRNRLIWELTELEADKILYEKSLEDHCAMTIYKSEWEH